MTIIKMASKGYAVLLLAILALAVSSEVSFENSTLDTGTRP